LNPELLHSLTAARGAPMPNEEGVHVDALEELFRRQRRLRDLITRLQRSGEMPIGKAEDEQVAIMARYFGCIADGRNTRSSRPPEWSHAECAQAAQGLDERYWMAMRYTYALDISVYHRLAYALLDWALIQREREKWPRRVVTLAGVEGAYMQDLVAMWLLEVWSPWRFKRETHDPRPDARRVIMNVSELVWRRRLSPIYEAIHAEFNVWLAIAHTQMGRRLRDEEIAE
jgi:hypothetical protein